MVQGMRVLHTGEFGAFTYSPTNDQYIWSQGALRVLSGAVNDGTSYPEALAHVPASVRRPYEAWRIATMESGQPGSARIPFQLAVGLRMVEVHLHQVGDKVAGFLVNVTDDEAEHEALQTQVALVNFAERMAGFGTWSYELASGRMRLSAGAKKLLSLGRDSNESTLATFLAATHPDFRGGVKRALERALATGQVQQAELRSRDGLRRLTFQCMRILDFAGEPSGACGMLLEPPETGHWKKEYERSQELHEMRSRFVNAAAHELNQPLTPMRFALEMLSSRLPAQDEVMKGFRMIQRNLDRLEFMLRDLLDAARLQAGHINIESTSVDLGARVQHVVETLRPVAKRRSVMIEWERLGMPLVEGDPMRVEQCLSNLIHNAIKFTAEGTQVHVAESKVSDFVHVSVQDHGPGLDERQQAMLFEPFQQLHPSPAGFPGTGLGLYITKQLTDAMGGRIDVDSRPHEGSTFTLVLKTA